MKHFTFLICTERSGGNFISSLMNGHPRICGPPPSHLFRLFAKNRANYGDLASPDNWEALVDDCVACFEAKLGSWSTTTTRSELFKRATRRGPAELLRLIYEKESEHDGATHIFVKENHTYSFAPFLLAGFPGCRFVWMVRDPRDVASSWVRTRSIPGGVEKAVEIWTRDQEASQRLYDQLRDSGTILRVRYEELVDQTPQTLRELVSFLELPYDEGMLHFYDEPRTAANAARIEAWANLGRPVLHGNTGKFHQVLSESDQRYVELACGPLMESLGYARGPMGADPGEEDRAAEMDALRPLLSPGGYEVPSAEERAIRERRLAAIEQVLKRRLTP